MKIAVVTPWNVRCGIYTYSRELCNSLKEQGIDIYIVRLPRFGTKTPDIMRLVASSIPDEVEIVHLEHEYGLYQGLEGVFYNALREKGKPIITTMHAVGNWDLDSVISSFSDMVITHNEFCARRFDHPNVIIPHGCSPQKTVDAYEAKSSYGLKVEWPIVGYLGFISKYKNLEILIDAMTGVPEGGLLIGGGWHTEQDTIYITRLKEDSFKRLPNRVQWLGYVQDHDMPRAYGAMDVIVYPSRFATESGALLTAISYGKAVIASNLAPFREKSKQGAVTLFKTMLGLRRKIRKLLKEGKARHKLEDGARKYAEDNSWNEVARRHKSLYEKVIGR